MKMKSHRELCKLSSWNSSDAEDEGGGAFCPDFVVPVEALADVTVID